MVNKSCIKKRGKKFMMPKRRGTYYKGEPPSSLSGVLACFASHIQPVEFSIVRFQLHLFLSDSLRLTHTQTHHTLTLCFAWIDCCGFFFQEFFACGGNALFAHCLRFCCFWSFLVWFLSSALGIRPQCPFPDCYGNVRRLRCWVLVFVSPKRWVLESRVSVVWLPTGTVCLWIYVLKNGWKAFSWAV